MIETEFRVVQMARLMIEGVEHGEAAQPMTAEGYYAMGLAYASGRGQPVDYVSAHKWFNVAMMLGYQAAAARRSELSAEMSRDEIAAALREARAFVTRH
jgi:hypothetical protein